jgi:hypothetical protein
VLLQGATATLSSGSGDFYGSWLPKSGRFDIGVSEQG